MLPPGSLCRERAPGMGGGGQKPCSSSHAAHDFLVCRSPMLDGPMKRQFEENHARFQHLDDDRMLKVYRQVAGLAAPGEDMGGWYDLTGFAWREMIFMGSSRVTVSGSTFRDWPERMQSPDPRRRAPRLIAW